jgi:hypothetical protein
MSHRVTRETKLGLDLVHQGHGVEGRAVHLVEEGEDGAAPQAAHLGKKYVKKKKKGSKPNTDKNKLFGSAVSHR